MDIKTFIYRFVEHQRAIFHTVPASTLKAITGTDSKVLIAQAAYEAGFTACLEVLVSKYQTLGSRGVRYDKAVKDAEVIMGNE